jgi:hypothetical protein
MNNKILYIVIVLLAAIIVGGGVYFIMSKTAAPKVETGNPPAPAAPAPTAANENPPAPPTPAPAAPVVPLSEQPNQAKYAEYFSDIYLGSMPTGTTIGTDGFPTKTNVFVKGKDFFCTMMTLIKTIPAGSIGNAIYDTGTKKDYQPKTVFPMELKAGGTGGCQGLSEPVGQYEDKVYVDNVLAAVLPFSVK